jgi:nucleoside-diphosphate-sugar epimerase
LVIGGRGFVGSALASAAAGAGWRVSVVGRDDYRDQIGRPFDVVINANGNAKRFKADAEPLWDFDNSVRPVYESVLDFPSAHYVLISSVDVYNDTRDADATAECEPIDPARLRPYGFHKRIAELCVARGADSWQIFRLAQMVSPALTKGPIFDLLHGRPLWIHPASELPYLHTRTAADVIVRVIANGPRQEIYNVCGRGSVEFARVLALVGRSPSDQAYAECEPQMYRINTDKTHRLCSLPESWNEIRTFIQAATAVHDA